MVSLLCTFASTCHCQLKVKELVNSENVNRELEKKDTWWCGMCYTTTTALHEAVRYGQVSIVEYLLQVGADVEKKDSDGRTALEVAVEEVTKIWHVSIVKGLTYG